MNRTNKLIAGVVGAVSTAVFALTVMTAPTTYVAKPGVQLERGQQVNVRCIDRMIITTSSDKTRSTLKCPQQADASASPTASVVPSTPIPTVAPTVAPTPIPTAVPIATPAPVACVPNLQTAINNTPTGGTLTLGACTFHEAVIVNRAMTIRGQATINGDGVRQSWMNVQAADVTVDGLSFTNAAKGGFQCGSLYVSGARFTGKNLKLNHGCYADIALWVSAVDAKIENVDAWDGPALSLIAFQADRLIVSGGKFHDNRGATDIGNESGGIKICGRLNATLAAVPATVTGVEAYNNVGPGIWLDCFVNQAFITNNKAHDNTRSGIMYEIGDTATISGNTVYRNGTEQGGNSFEMRCGIFVSSSSHVTVKDNTAAWNAPGSHTQPTPGDICFVSQDRDPRPHIGNSATNNVVRIPPTAYTASGNDTRVILTPNTLVADTDPRIVGLK